MMRPDKNPPAPPATERKQAHERREVPARVAAHVHTADFQDSLFGQEEADQAHYTPPNTAAYAKLDGVTHCNIYSKGRTELGRQLSHFANTPFVHPHYGPFHSMEGFWYYIKAAEEDDTLRTLWGRQAKEYGKRLPIMRRDNFKQLIIEANFYKIEQTSEIKRMMEDSALRFDHYYLFGNGPVFVRPPGFGWLVEGFEEIRRLLKWGKLNNQQVSWPAQQYFSHAQELERSYQERIGGTPPKASS